MDLTASLRSSLRPRTLVCHLRPSVVAHSFPQVSGKCLLIQRRTHPLLPVGDGFRKLRLTCLPSLSPYILRVDICCALVSEALLLTSHQSHRVFSQGGGSGNKGASLIHSGLGFSVNFPLPVVSITQGNLNSDITVCGSDLSWNKILHLNIPSVTLGTETAALQCY